MAVRNDTIELVKLAMRAFMDYWEENAVNAPMYDMDPVTGKYEVRNPDTAMEMLYNYIENRRNMLSSSQFQLIAIEQPFAVPLDPENPHILYIGRLDKVYEYIGRIYVGEHKTTTFYKRDGYFRREFVDSFSPNSQIDGYSFAAYIIYGKRVKGVNVDAALVHEKEHDGFKLIPIDRQFQQLTGWLWETNHWIAQIQINTKILEENDADFKKREYLPAFPKNPNSCTQYGNCPYMDVCKMWANPHREEVPPGFVVKPWHPFDELELADVKGQVTFVDPDKGASAKKINKKKDELYDNTRVSTFRVCPRKYYFRHIRHWDTLADRRPLLFGGAWHRAMDVVWTHLAPNWNSKTVGTRKIVPRKMPAATMAKGDQLVTIKREQTRNALRESVEGIAEKKVGHKVPWISTVRK